MVVILRVSHPLVSIGKCRADLLASLRWTSTDCKMGVVLHSASVVHADGHSVAMCRRRSSLRSHVEKVSARMEAARRKSHSTQVREWNGARAIGKRVGIAAVDQAMKGRQLSWTGV